MIIEALIFTVILAILIYYFIKRYDQVDLQSSEIGKECNHGKSFKTSVVIGGSISGLCTAAALASHSEKVIIIEKAARKENESIVPHGKALHVLLCRGLEIMEKLLPNIKKEILATSALSMDWGTDSCWWAKGGMRYQTKEKGKMGVDNILISRNSLEPIVRRRVERIPNIEIMYETEVKELLFNSKTRNINGIKYFSKQDNNEVELFTDLVADCSGFSTNNHKWFQKLGLTLESTKVKTYLSYSNRLATCDPDKEPSYKAMYYQQVPPNLPYAFVATKIENNQWMHLYISLNKNPVPRNPDDAMKFLEDNNMTEAIDLTKRSNLSNDFHVVHKVGNEYTYFDRLHISGYVALGDCVCNFNPAYGQGMTTACETVLLLDDMLRKQGYSSSFCSNFQAQVGRQLTFPFLLASLNDIRFPGTETQNSSLGLLRNLANIALDRVSEKCATNEYVMKKFLEVMHMKQGFIWNFFDPKFVYNVLM